MSDNITKLCRNMGLTVEYHKLDEDVCFESFDIRIFIDLMARIVRIVRKKMRFSSLYAEKWMILAQDVITNHRATGECVGRGIAGREIRNRYVQPPSIGSPCCEAGG